MDGERAGAVVTAESTPLAAENPREPDRRAVVSRGTRVYLRTLRPEDLEHLSDWAEDPFIARMVGSEFLNTYKHVFDKDPSFYEAVLTDTTQVVLVVEGNHGWQKPLGLARLFNIHLLEGYAFLEVVLTDHKALRRGFGVEAGKLISYYGVDVLGLRRIEAKVYEYNSLSANSLRRNGFQQEGVLRKAAYQDGRYWDVLVFGILREGIEEQRKRDKPYLPLPEPEGGRA
jgi:RimJ/RimL family protein N-acetyltransferase